MDTIVIAHTIAEAKAEYPRAVAVVTPRSPDAARGKTAHRIVVLASMRDHPRRDELVEAARPALVFRSSEVRFS